MKRLAAVGAALAVAVSGVAVMGAGGAEAAGTSWGTAKVVRWIDGDTVVTSKGTVRLIGIDTPERGKCGAKTATAKARVLAPIGSTVKLGNPVSVDDNDRYGRKLRYVDKGTRDIGAAQIKAGAKARYDSRDGYDRHPRQASYRALDARYKNYKCSSTPPPAPGNPWEERVNRPGPDIDCGDIPARYKPVRIWGEDYHGLDRDGDGWGCDS
jgi:endonuclease YncB( thermonuclease family)